VKSQACQGSRIRVRPWAGVALISAVVAGLCAGLPAYGQEAGAARGDPITRPLTLAAYKSFFIGGERVTHKDGSVGLSGQAYVEAFIPENAKPTPIVMVHNSISGAMFLQRSNGEEGWATMFARAGYPVYVVDPPGTGRAGVDLTVYDKGKIAQGNSEQWAGWKLGPKFGEQGVNLDPAQDATAHAEPMNQMPTDPESVDNWLATRMTYTLDPGDEVVNKALFALMEKIGPVIWMGWSGGGERAQDLVIARPELFKAIAHLEGCRQGSNTAQFIAAVATHHIPVLHVNPDYARAAGARSGANYLPSGSRCVSPVDVAAEVKNKGGVAETIYLPDLGIRGNGHQFMLQNNADEIARVYVDWLDRNVH
jgi:pimeloyl-ACP methyl ester carboxylesterase